MKKRGKNGFTIVELIITLVIVGILFGSGYMYMSGYIPKQNLNTTATGILTMLQMAQSKSMTHGARFGVYFKKTVDKTYACIFRDFDPAVAGSVNDWKCTNCELTAACGAAETRNYPSFIFKSWVELLPSNLCTDAGSILVGLASEYDTILFDIKGFAYKKAVPPSTVGTLSSFVIFPYHSKFKAGEARVKEIEVGSGGLIELMKATQGAGNLPGQANAGTCQ